MPDTRDVGCTRTPRGGPGGLRGFDRCRRDPRGCGCGGVLHRPLEGTGSRRVRSGHAACRGCHGGGGLRATGRHLGRGPGDRGRSDRARPTDDHPGAQGVRAGRAGRQRGRVGGDPGCGRRLDAGPGRPHGRCRAEGPGRDRAGSGVGISPRSPTPMSLPGCWRVRRTGTSCTRRRSSAGSDASAPRSGALGSRTCGTRWGRGPAPDAPHRRDGPRSPVWRACTRRS